MAPEAPKWLEINQCSKQATTQEAINKCNPGFHLGKIETATLNAIDNFGNLTIRKTNDENGVPAIAIDMKNNVRGTINGQIIPKTIILDQDTLELKSGLTKTQLTLLSVNKDGTIDTIIFEKWLWEIPKKAPQDIAQDVLEQMGLRANISYNRTNQKAGDFLEISGLPGGISKSIHIPAFIIDQKEIEMDIKSALKEFSKNNR